MNSHNAFSLVLLFLLGSVGFADELTRDELNFFETKIRPVLVRECYGCHSNKAGNVRGGLRLDTKQLTHIGGGSGPAIVPGNVEESWLYNAITHQDFVMPPKRKLPQDVIDDFRKWIEMGAPDPRVNLITKVNSQISAEDIRQAQESFWAYQPPVKKKPLKVENSSWPRSDIDRFILAELEANEIAPPRDADAWQVVRRLSFDLVGLPPTPEEIDAFTSQWKSDPDAAVAATVERLLKKPQYGERWGRHWLDVARYAESTGREVNMTFPQAWRYRDYVIDSFNNDKPYDRFIQEQIAGDLLPIKSDAEWAENLVATSFLAIGAKNVNEQNPVQFAANLADEQIDATTRVFLGMSVACARCHDHKFDAIRQEDYYALAGIFNNMKTYFGNPQSKYGAFSSAQERQSSSLMILPIEDPNPFDARYSERELDELREEMTSQLREFANQRRNRSRNSATSLRERLQMLNRLANLSGRLAAVDDNGDPYSFTMGVQELDSPRDSKLLVRGEIDQPAQTVPRGFPTVMTEHPVKIEGRQSGRLELAQWIGSDRNSLAARVMVNRIWLHLLGNGLVRSTENFGTTGQSPSHPELLDYLAVRFVESGWSVKSVIREIATSRVYRIASTFNAKYHEQDPDNRLLWRANPRRLDAEALRDAMLHISGELDFERPRASEVAKAGYTRVQSGRLGRPGSSNGSMRRPQQGGRDFASRLRPGMQRGNGPFNPFGRGPRPGGGQFRQRGAANSNPLDMETAKFRSVYLPIVRDEEPRSLAVFDYADSSAIIGERESSNTANQALYLMNNPFVLQQSSAFARRIWSASISPEEKIRQAFLWTYGRPPTPGERRAVASFLREFDVTNRQREQGRGGLAAFCQSLFASAEFRYLD